MTESIVFLTDYPFNPRDCERFGIATLKKRFSVQVWDVTAPVFGSAPAGSRAGDAGMGADLVVFEEKADLLAALSRLDSQSLLLLFFDLTHQTAFIFREVSRRRLRYAVLQMVTFPDPGGSGHGPAGPKGPQGRVGKTLQRAKGFDIRAFRRYCYEAVRRLDNPLLYRITGIRPADIVILTGEQSGRIRKYPTDPGTTRYVWAHTLDYDAWLSARNGGPERTGPYAVFLDEDYPYHEEFDRISGSKPPFTPVEYFSLMGGFFDRFERETGLPVVIAAHPRSTHLGEMRAGYGRPDGTRRDVVQGRTPQLVKDASLVITHMSTAINFAVLFRKPLLFVTTDTLEGMVSGDFKPGIYLATVARALGRVPVNADHPALPERESLFSVDEAAYHAYRQAFIKKDGTPALPFWEIVARAIGG